MKKNKNAENVEQENVDFSIENGGDNVEDVAASTPDQEQLDERKEQMKAEYEAKKAKFAEEMNEKREQFKAELAAKRETLKAEQKAKMDETREARKMEKEAGRADKEKAKLEKEMARLEERHAKQMARLSNLADTVTEDVANSGLAVGDEVEFTSKSPEGPVTNVGKVKSFFAFSDSFTTAVNIAFTNEAGETKVLTRSLFNVKKA